MSHRFLIRPEAEADLAEAKRWYEQRREGLMGEEIVVIGVLHGRRDPSRWQSRA